MHIQFDSKNKDEVFAVKAAVDFLAMKHAETIKFSVPPIEVIPPEPQPVPTNGRDITVPIKKSLIGRNRENVIFEGKMSDAQRRKYPGLYPLAFMTYTWMKPEKLYALSEVQEYMLHIGHPKTSASAVLTHMVKEGYAQRPMKALYRRLEK